MQQRDLLHEALNGSRSYDIDESGCYVRVSVACSAENGFALTCWKRIGEQPDSDVRVVAAIDGLLRVSDLEVTMRTLGLSLPAELRASLRAEELAGTQSESYAIRC